MTATPRAAVVPRSRWRAVVLALVLALGTAASRAEAACTVTVNATVAFGAYNVFTAAPLDTTGQISYRCSRNTYPAVQITLTRGGSITWTSRRLAHGSDTLLYNIYLDSARTRVWGDGTSGTYAYYGTYPGSGRVYINMFARIPAAQDAAVGTYSDTVTVVINF